MQAHGGGEYLPVIALRGLVVFPGSSVRLQIGRRQSLRAVTAAVTADGRVLLCSQRDPAVEEPDTEDLYDVGTVAVLRDTEPDADGSVRVMVEGLCRARVLAYTLAEPLRPGAHGCLLARVVALPEEEAPADGEAAALAATLRERYEQWQRAGGRLPPDAPPLPPVEQPGRLADAVAAIVLQRHDERQQVLEAATVQQRLDCALRLVTRLVEQGQVQRDLQRRVRHELDRAQREYYLREQLKAIQKELGELDGAQRELEELRARLEAAGLPPPASERARRELERLERMPPLSPEAVVVRAYLDWIVALPWSKVAEESLDLGAVQRLLDQEHYGLQRPKERILEHLALQILRGRRPRGAVLCLVGPPGSGKTSLARSMARAMGRPFVRVSLGGVRDEAEIRGHRRTYVGALPGRILHGMRQAGVRNPVFLLDEIDKLGADFRGDPAAALLEVLDPEQNAAFSDHYLELPFDLSQVTFVTTANSLAPLPRPLFDRLEVVELHGYGADEKLRIARSFLLPRQLAECGLPPTALRVTDGAIRAMVDGYTREAGVRGLERQLAAICRRVAREVVRRPDARVTVTARTVPRYLGGPRVFRQAVPEQDEVGVAVALAWTEDGGAVLTLEVSVLPGTGTVQFTGRLGEVMRESAQAALTYLRARSERFGLPADFLRHCELHVHAPEGAVPKEGPSAGAALAVALLSALTGVPVRREVALTGEVTLRGRLLPVGGIKEKVLAARRAGARHVVLPAGNRHDWQEMLRTTAPGVMPCFVEHLDEALAAAMVGGLPGADLVRTHVPAPLRAAWAEAPVAAGVAGGASGLAAGHPPLEDGPC